jgi:hypothetical protein
VRPYTTSDRHFALIETLCRRGKYHCSVNLVRAKRKDHSAWITAIESAE